MSLPRATLSHIVLVNLLFAVVVAVGAGVYASRLVSQLNSPEFQAQLREEMAPGARKILLYVGRLAPEKRLDVLMEAFARIDTEEIDPILSITTKAA
mgnify:CR=1 FL=1